MRLSRHQRCLGLALAALVANAATVASAQPFKMTTPIAPGVATPDRLDTSIGPLNLIDGFPKPDTIEKKSTTTWIAPGPCRLICWPSRS